MLNKYKELEFGYIIQTLHNHIPTLQMFGKKRTNKPRWKALKEMIIFLDEYLIHFINNYELHFSKQNMDIRKIYTNKDFQIFLNINFYRSPYLKGVEARKFYIRAFLHHAIVEIIKFIIKNDKYDKLFETYYIDIINPQKKFMFRNVKFSSSIFYDDFILNKEKEPNSIIDQLYKNYACEDTYINNKIYFSSLEKASITLTEKINLTKIYGFSAKKSNNLSKSNDDVLTIKFNKGTDKKNTEINTTLINTKLHINIDKDYLFSIVNETNDLKILLTIIYILKNQSQYIYYEKKNFRYMTNKNLNKINFQGIEKKIRNIVFKGQYDYDLNAAAPTLLYQFIKKEIPNIEFPFILEYIKDRNIIRDECIRLLKEKNSYMKYEDIKKEVKSLITSLFYGAKIENAQSTLKMSSSNRKYLLRNSENFNKLFNDIKNLFNTYKKEFIQNKYSCKKTIQMPNGFIDLKDCQEKNRSHRKIISDIYFSLESQILDLIYERYKDSLTLLIHDGFISKDELDVNELEKLVKDELGYDVKYEKVKL